MNKIDEQLMKEMVLASRFIIRPHGHPMVQEDIIRKLSNGPLNQKDLQEDMHVRPGTISEVVSKLEEKGYLTRTKSQDDGRAVLLELTTSGQDKLNNLSEREELFTAITDEEKETLKDILTKLNNDWIRRGPIEHMGPRPPHSPFDCHHHHEQPFDHHHHHEQPFDHHHHHEQPFENSIEEEF